MKNKKRLLFIIPSLDIGGAQVFCANLVHEFSEKKEYDVHIIVYFNIIHEKFSDILSGNVTLHILNKKPGFSLKFLRSLKKTINKINPDIINSHSSHALRYLLLIRNLRKIPIIHTITNDPAVHDTLSYLLVKRRIKQQSWKHLSFVGISKLISNNLTKVYNCDPNRITTIYNGLYKLEQQGSIKERYDFFNCANLTSVKRQTLLLQALAKMKYKATLCIAGSGPEENNLKKLCSDLDILDRVFFKGSVPNPVNLYFSSRVFILTSYSEGNPICINEAMSAGLPVIATNVGGIPDLIETGINGFLFDNDSTPEELAILMDKTILLDDETIATIKNNNQEKVKQWYMDSIVDQYNDLIIKKLF